MIIDGVTIKGAKDNAIFAKTTTESGKEVLDVRNLNISNVTIEDCTAIPIVAFAEVLTINNVEVRNANLNNNSTSSYHLYLAAREARINNFWASSTNVTTDIVVDLERFLTLLPSMNLQINNSRLRSTTKLKYYTSGGALQIYPTANVTIDSVIKAENYNILNDGITDNAASLRTLMSSLDGSKSTIVFPESGKIIIGSTVLVGSNVRMIGGNFKLKDASNTVMFKTRDTVASPAGYPHDIQFKDMVFDLNRANNTTKATAIESTKCRNLVVKGCVFNNYKGNCILVSGSDGNNIQPRIVDNQFDFGDTTDGVGIKLDTSCYDSYLESNDIGRSWRGIIVSNGGDGNHSLINNWCWANADCGILLFQSHNVLMVNNTQDQNYGLSSSGAGMCIDGCNNVSISNNKASNNSWRDVSNIMGLGVIGTVNINPGIRVYGASSNIRISSSIFSNPNGGQQYGIKAEGSSTVFYNNCTFTDQQTANTNEITGATITNLDNTVIDGGSA